MEPDGVRWADGAFEAVDVIASSSDVQSATTAADDPRVQLVGYGPSASTIGGNRAGRAAALAVQRLLRGDARVA
jgi:hypothetical protein